MPQLPVISPPTGPVPGCCEPPREENSHGTKFHFSMNVTDLEKSVAFYRVLFGVPPAKHYPDYAKFELDQPPLVFSLVPNPPAAGGALSHLGFPVASRSEVEAVGKRLEQAGLSVSCQDGSVCGYSLQDKVWVADPDHNYWEIYVRHEEVDPEAVRRGFDGISPQGAEGLPVVESTTVVETRMLIWEHRVLDALPDRLPYPEGSIEEVRLEGTFNSALSDDDRKQLLAMAFKGLKSGGRVSVHGLASNVSLKGRLPALPGVAALVRRIPTESEPVKELTASGFTGIVVTKLPESAVFRDGAVEIREIKLTAYKSFDLPADSNKNRIVVYKGPMAEAIDDRGTRFPRGVRVAVSSDQWEELGRGAAAPQFLFIDLTSAAACGTGCSE